VGIGSDIVDLIVKLRLDGYIGRRPSVMEIGAQQLSNDFLRLADDVVRLGHLFGVVEPLRLPPSPPSRHIVHGTLEHLNPAAPPARDFWLWLGFSYAAIDIDGSPGSIPLDLNFDCVPPGEFSKYDLVTNFGTTEHVVNQLNAFKIIHDLTAPGGLMIHSLPAGGFLNHGLMNYTPKFFWMLARGNGYRFLRAEFSRSSATYDFPDNIVAFLNTLDPQSAERARPYKVADEAILVVMQKAFDIPFMAPIDVGTGTTTDFEPLRNRYWTVFQPNAFEKLVAQGKSSTARARRRLRRNGSNGAPHI
jgi:hypothetical protein